MINNRLSIKNKTNNYKGFAIPTVLMASIIMLTVLVVTVSAVVAVRVALKEQYYNLLSKTASSAGIAYAEACLAANGGVPLSTWTDINPLMPNTDCGGNLLVDCTVGNNLTTNSLCSITFSDTSNGRLLSTFKVGRPTLNSGGQAIGVVSNGSTNLLRSSNNSVWRSYNQTARLNNVAGGVYTYPTPGFYTVTLPSSVTAVQIEVWGAGAGGRGGYAKGTKAITTDRTLYIYVGGTNGTGGSTGGAGGYWGSYYQNPSGPVANGGGSSDVRITANDLAHRIIVGGGAGDYNGGTGAGTGGMAGANGGNGESGVMYNPGGTGGGGGYVGGIGGTQGWDDYDNGVVNPSYGGTSYVDPSLTGTVLTSGVQSGNGKVVLQTIIGTNQKIYY